MACCISEHHVVLDTNVELQLLVVEPMTAKFVPWQGKHAIRCYIPL